MGDFTTTCCVSGLPIYCGDEVRLVILRPTRSNIENRVTSILEPGSLYIPVALPVCGTTGDYGDLESVVEDIPTRFLTQFFEKAEAAGLLTFSAGFQDPSDDGDPKIMRYIAAMAQTLLVSNEDFIKRTTEQWVYTLIREDVWQALIGPGYIHRDGHTLADGVRNAAEETAIYQGQLDAVFDWYAAYYAMRPQLKEDPLGDRLHFAACDAWARAAFRLEMPHKLMENGRKYIGSLMSNDTYVDEVNFLRYWERITEGIESGTLTKDSTDWQKMRDSLVGMIVFSRAMRWMEKTYLPVRTRGQSREWTKYQIFTAALLEILAKGKERMYSDDEDDEE